MNNAAKVDNNGRKNASLDTPQFRNQVTRFDYFVRVGVLKAFLRFRVVHQAGATRIGPVGFVLGDALHRAGCGKRHLTFTITVSGGFIILWHRTNCIDRGSNR
jgi:hypothetical protein